MRYTLMALALLLTSPLRADQQADEAAQYVRMRQPAKIVAALELRPGLRVADVGAGRGFLTLPIAAAVGPSGHVVATDVDGAQLAAIPHRANVETRVVAAGEPGLEAGRYDRILLAQVDHLLPDRAAYFHKLAAALAPGGFIAVSNRFAFREDVETAARAAGLQVHSVAAGLPTNFFLRIQSL